MARIERLTEAQAARLPVFRDEYLAHGRSTLPADRSRAEAAFARAYRTIGREPVPVVWVDSPMTASLAFQAIKGLGKNASLSESLGASLRASLGASLWASLRESLRESLGASLSDGLWASLGASLGASLWASLGESLGASLWASLGASLGAISVPPQLTYWWGQHDLHWIAFYKFCADVGVTYDQPAAERLDIMHEIALSCMWWYPRDGLIIACERPSAVCVDGAGRLHNEHGPAVAFRDGWATYAVHGVRVPADVAEWSDDAFVADHFDQALQAAEAKLREMGLLEASDEASTP